MISFIFVYRSILSKHEIFDNQGTTGNQGFDNQGPQGEHEYNLHVSWCYGSECTINAKLLNRNYWDKLANYLFSRRCKLR